MQYSSPTFDVDSSREIGQALKGLIAYVRAFDVLQPLQVVSPETMCPGAEVFVLPPGIRLVRQYDIQRSRDRGRFDVWGEVAS